MTRAVLAALALAALLFAPRASAHAMRSGYVEVIERGGDSTVRLRTTVRGTSFAVMAPSGCHFDDGAERVAPDRESLMARASMTCAGSLSGRSLTVEGLGTGLEEVVVLYENEGGARTTALLRGEDRQFVFPGGPAPSAFAGYVKLGAEHIAGGLDHLVFLLLLVLTLRRLRHVLVAETAFTVSHCVSFSLTATGLVRVPSAPTEVLIALSVVLMALDVPRRRRGEQGPSPRAAASIAFLFGAVHGLGFAGGLREIGLPEDDVAAALAGFALGVEAGQVAFILVLAVAGAIVARAASRLGSFAERRLLPSAEEALVVLAGGWGALLAVTRLLSCFGA